MLTQCSRPRASQQAFSKMQPHLYLQMMKSAPGTRLPGISVLLRCFGLSRPLTSDFMIASHRHLIRDLGTNRRCRHWTDMLLTRKINCAHLMMHVADWRRKREPSGLAQLARRLTDAIALIASF